MLRGLDEIRRRVRGEELLEYLDREILAMLRYHPQGEMAQYTLERDLSHLTDLRDDLSCGAIVIDEVLEELGCRVLPVSNITGKLRQHSFQDLF